MMHLPSPSLLASLSAAALLGARHGLDCDHIAAISDLVNVEKGMRRSLRLGLSYIAGHSLVIAVLGSAAISLQLTLPPVIDIWMGRMVGATLIAFSIYVGFSLLRVRPQHHHFHARSRVVLLIDGIRWLLFRLRRMIDPLTPSPGESWSALGNCSSFVIGIVHGFGAETPTQLLLFLMAASIGGIAMGFLALLLFILGMALINTLLCVLMTQMVRKTATSPGFQRALSGITAVYSLVIGTIMLCVPAILSRASIH
jgi:high-affinity nickel permease